MTPERRAVFYHSTETPIGQWLAAELATHAGESNFYPLPSGPFAFAARLALVRAAERSLDVQCHALRDDSMGCAFLAELLQAADRGVRVRLLLDDFHTSGIDLLLAALASHLNIQVRLFNPFYRHATRRFGLLIHRNRLSRRMHNTLFVADGQIAVVGGRRISDDGFETSTPVDFSGLDVMVVGRVTRPVSACFNHYWNSYVVLPIGPLLLEPPDDDAIRRERVRLHQSLRSESMAASFGALPDLDLLRARREKRLEVFSGFGHVIADAPEKITKSPELDTTHAISQLAEILSLAKRELIVVAPDFVPGADGAQWLESVARGGVRVRVLTQSFLATGNAATHAAYGRFRRRLLRAGIELHELKPDAALSPRKHAGVRPGAKAYLADRRALVLGTLNLDPLSGGLNTEMGVVLESPALAARLANDFDRRILDDAYRVELRPVDGKMIWLTRDNGREQTFEREPGIGFFRSIEILSASLLSEKRQW